MKSDSYCLSYVSICFNLRNNFLNLLSGVIQSGSRVAVYTYVSDGRKLLGVGDFVHEVTHAGQFETGDIAFNAETGGTLAQDIYDEIAAYQAQFAYDPGSISGLSSTHVANSFGAITPSWVQGLKDATGAMPYTVASSANTGLIPININSTRDAFIQAYPWNVLSFRGLPANYNIKSLPKIYYKR